MPERLQQDGQMAGLGFHWAGLGHTDNHTQLYAHNHMHTNACDCTHTISHMHMCSLPRASLALPGHTVTRWPLLSVLCMAVGRWKGLRNRRPALQGS